MKVGELMIQWPKHLGYVYLGQTVLSEDREAMEKFRAK